MEEAQPRKFPWSVTAQKEFERNPELKAEDLESLRTWIISQSHLPQSVEDEMLLHFLHACYFNVNNTKSTIELFYSYRTQMTEFFTDWDPLSKDTQDTINNILIAAPLPGADEDGNKVIVCKLNDTDPAKFNYPSCVKWLLITAQVAQWDKGIQNGYIIVYDASGFTMSHLLKCSLGTIKNYINWGKIRTDMFNSRQDPCIEGVPGKKIAGRLHDLPLTLQVVDTYHNVVLRFIIEYCEEPREVRTLKNASPIRVLRVVFINTSPVVKRMLTLVKPFLSKELLNMMKFYTDTDTYFASMSKDNVPEDYGGSAPPLLSLHREYMKRILEHRQHLMEEEKMKSDESKRIGKSKKDIKQAEKSFKNLEID